ncbi:MAG: OmpA family protein [Thiohalomonadales bacterium]|nr:OmpA family protein [Thiohalomonadales bacterium]
MTATSLFNLPGKTKWIYLIGVIFLASACTTIDPYTREEKTSKATTGAIIGAVGGAVVGAVSGSDSRDRRNRALIGAGIGALAGGSVGYYMDVQEAKLRKQLEGTGVRVVRNGDNITLVMPGNVTFDVDKADIKASFYPVLDSVALVVDEYDKTIIDVVGHTDSTGSHQYNQALSERRADSVARYLISQKVDRVRIETFGMGETRPIASNATAEGRQLNRRVELTLIPVTK